MDGQAYCHQIPKSHRPYAIERRAALLRGRRRECGSVEEIRPGDVVWFEPGERHWHGAAPNNAMSHTAIQENIDGKVVDWMEEVTEAQ